MDILGFTFSVWSAIALGVLFFILVGACAHDRRTWEGVGKGWLVVILIMGLGVWISTEDMSWSLLVSPGLWKMVGLYLGLGLAYAVIEFFFAVRREQKEWASRWNYYKSNPPLSSDRRPAAHGNPSSDDENEPVQSLESSFVTATNYRYSARLVKVALDEKDQVVPVVDKANLAAALAAWVLLWPAYAVSLVVGDLLEVVFEAFAKLLAAISQGYLDRVFATTFER